MNSLTLYKTVAMSLAILSVTSSMHARDEKIIPGRVYDFSEIVAIMQASTPQAAFDALLAQHDYVIVDFYASWCQPCKKMARIFDEVSKDFEGTDVIFVKINIDTFASLSNRFNIKSIPTIVSFKKGKRLSTMTGCKTNASVTTFIENGRKKK
ncbi:MAG: thioredoxin family protein [Candidatus Babeliales bacterium]